MKVICPAIYKQKKQEMKTTSNLPDYSKIHGKTAQSFVQFYHSMVEILLFFFLSNASSYVSIPQNKAKETFKPRNIEFRAVFI